MKRFASLMMALLLVLGSTGMAAAALTFNVDFWTDGSNATNNYSKSGPGDLGGIFPLLPGEKINADIYFSTDNQYIAGSWDLKFSPSAPVGILSYSAAGSPWALPSFIESPGSLKYEDLIFPPGSTITGDDKFFGSVLFQCLGQGDVNLTLTNYLGFLTATGQDNIIDLNLGTLNQVPIPGAAWLLGSGLVGLVAFSRKRRK